MKANLKRVLSFVLVMMLVLSCVPAVAFAAEDSHAAQNITTGAEYDSLAEAMEAAASGETVKVLADSDAAVTYTAGVILDLNGHNVSNVTVPQGITLTAIDSATDDYEGPFGSLTTDGNVATTVKTTGDVKSYVAIADNGSWSFHRYYAAITAISLKPGSAALGYKAEFYGDEAVKNAVVNYGYEMWLNDYAPKAMSKADKLEKNVLTLRLNNILKEGNDALNAIGSTAIIGGKAFITLNLNGEEVTLYSADQTTTLRKTIESINANVAAYSETALQAVRNLCTLYAPWMMGWATENIFGIGAGDTDLDVEVLVPVTAENNVVTAETVVKENNIVVTIPAGVQLADGADNLVLTIVDKDSSDSDVEAAEGEALRPMDVHIEGISADNTTPVIICLGNVLPKGLNIGNYDLYHVEDGKTVPMTRANSISELDAHNEFCYDPATGAVTVAVCSFSEIALSSNSSNPWNGNADRSWYDANKASFEIHNADQLAGLGALVDSGTTFDGKTIVMIRDINLYGLDANNERLSFNPIGFGYDDNQVFKGTFDGNGNTIFNLYQNCWSLGADVYTYSTAGGGLFAYVVDADFKNLIIDNAEIVLECIDMGSLVGYAYGTCSFTNIIVRNSKVANHNRYTGGVVGEVNGNHTFYNVDVEASTTLSGLWGSFGAACGGIIGGKWGDATVHMEKCDVACTLDVFNDVTSAYQWYAYRFCGMLIGNTEQSRTDNGRTTAKADFLTTKDCTVAYGDWAKYHYCEFSKMENLGARYPWVRVEPGLYTDPYSNIRYGHPIVNGETISSDNHNHAHEPGDGHMLEASFHQLYGGDQGVYGGNWHVTDNLGVTEINAPAPVQKFAENYDKRYPITEGTTLTLGQLFKASGLGTIQNLDVHAYVSPVNANDSVRGTFTKNNSDWTNSKLTFTGSGMAKITITDYYYCTATTITVPVGYQVKDLSSHSNGWNSLSYEDAGGLTFIAAASNAANSAYRPVNSDAVKLIRDGVTYNVGHSERDTLVKWNATDYYLNFWVFADHKPIQANDVIILEGLFYDANTGTYINVEKTYLICLSDNSVAVTKNGFVDAGALSNHAKGLFGDGIYAAMAANAAPSGSATEYSPMTADSYYAIRNGEKINVGIPGRGTLVKYSDAEYFLRISAWCTNNFAYTTDDIFVISGFWKNEATGCIMKIENSYLYYDGGTWNFTSVLPNVYIGSTMKNHENSHTNIGIYFNMDSNGAPSNSDWSLEYKQTNTNNIKIIRNGVETSIGIVGRPMFVKINDTEYFLKLEGWTVGEYGYGQSNAITIHDVLIIEGAFELESHNAILYIPKTYAYFVGTSWMFSTEMPDAAAIEKTVYNMTDLSSHNDGYNEDDVFFTATSDSASKTGLYRPTNTNVIQLIREGETKNVGHIQRGSIEKRSDTEYALKIWIFGDNKPMRVGDVVILDGLFYDEVNGIYINIERTYITFNTDGSVTVSKTAP